MNEKNPDPNSRNLPLAPAGAGEALPACPACDGPPTRCDCEPGCSMVVCLNPKCPMDAVHELLWRRLSAPRTLPPEVVAVLREAEVMWEEMATGAWPLFQLAMDNFVRAGRPGLDTPDAPEGKP